MDENLIFTRFNSQDSTSLLERNISKIAEKTKEIFESEFSQNKILSKIACIEICDENCTYICTSVFQFITYTRLRFPRIFFGKKKYAIEWDTVSSISPGLRAIESTHADLRLGRGVAWSRACPRYRSTGRQKTENGRRKDVWSGLGKFKNFFFFFFKKIAGLTFGHCCLH